MDLIAMSEDVLESNVDFESLSPEAQLRRFRQVLAFAQRQRDELATLRQVHATTLEATLSLIDADACERHHAQIREMPFEAFLEKHRQVGCRYCLHENSATLQKIDEHL